MGCKKDANVDKWVEINGIKWAKFNVNKPGTFVANAEDAGMFYQWNRRTGWSTSDPMANHEGGTAWNNTISEGDSWEKTNNPCPAGWRLPTHEEQTSLVASSSEWTILNGVTGRSFGSGEHTVFFPAAGGRYGSDGTLDLVGNYGGYWSDTPNPSGSAYAYGIYFRSESAGTSDYFHRSGGLSVRCVSE